MPEPIVVNPLVSTAGQGVDAAAHNAEIAAKLAAQDAAGRSTAPKPGDFEEAASALDKLAAAVPDPKKPVVEPVHVPDPNPPTPEELKAAEEAAAKKVAEEAEAAAKKAAEEAAAAKGAEALKDVPDLPENVSQKSRDHWNALKSKAAQEIAARDAKLAELQKNLTELQERAKNPTTEQLEKEKELLELRNFRASLDVQFDPQFKQFDTKIAQNEEFIYAQLRKSPAVGDNTIEQIKKFGGPDKCILTKLFEGINDPTLQRIVESKIAENAQLRYQKDQALTATKANMEQYLQEKQKSYAEVVNKHQTDTQVELNKFVGALEWTKPRELAGNDAEKAAAADYNKWLDQVKSEVADGLRDDSPQMRAVLLTSYAQMCFLKRENASMISELASVKKELASITAKWEAVKKAGTSRLRESAAPPSGALPQPKPSTQFNTPAVDALDQLAKSVMEERAAKGI